MKMQRVLGAEPLPAEVAAAALAVVVEALLAALSALQPELL